MKKLTLLVTILWSISSALAAEDPTLPAPSEERDKALIQGAFDGDLAKVQALLKKGVLATMRKSRGEKIMAACGQLKASAGGVENAR